MNKTLHFILIFSCIIGCNEHKTPGWIDAERLTHQEPRDWLSLGGNQLMQHYSPLNQIGKQNIKDLGYAWESEVPTVIGTVNHGLEATPIVVDGILYTSGPWGFVYALDGQTGKKIWTYDPNVDASYGRRACCDVVNRGVAVWKSRVYVGTLDGFLVCLNAADGAEIWRQDTFTDRSKAYTITGPPQVAGNIVMIGNSGGEYGVRGYITAYDLSDGKMKWRFYTVPGNPAQGFEHEEMEAASKTWDPNSLWDFGGGGTVWGESAYDPESNLLYVGTGNSTPYPQWYRSPAGGDNLFLSSILAINPDDGKLVWHYQTTPGEIWDYTATMNIVLATIEWKGQPRKVLMQAPKNGFFYVLDRVTGELLSAEKYTAANWASRVDLNTGRPVLTEQGQWYDDEPKLVVPSIGGGHNWQPMAYSPATGLVYIPERSVPMVYQAKKNSAWKPDEDNSALDYDQMFNFSKVLSQINEASDTSFSRSLLAWDPVTQKRVWQVNTGAPDGGVMATPELVFQGTRTGYLRVFDARTGEMLKEIFTGTGIMAAPATYDINGEQYVAVMAAYGGSPSCCYPPDAVFHKYENVGRILAFKLGGKETPMPSERKLIKTPSPPVMTVQEELVIKGASIYNIYCGSYCHGGFGENHHSLHPDLSKMSEAKHQLFEDILLKGILSPNGMANFSNSLSKEDVQAIHHYLIKVQREQYDRQVKEEVQR